MFKSKNIAVFLVAALLSGCTLFQSTATDDGAASSGSSADRSGSSVLEGERSSSSSSSSLALQGSASSVSSPTASVRTIVISADNWSFTPSTITVKKGEKVRLQLKGINGIHGFLAADLGINVAVNPGDVLDVDLPTDKEGTFSFACNIPCGTGHQNMKGTIVIAG